MAWNAAANTSAQNLAQNVALQTSLTLNLQAYPKDTVSGGYWTGTLNDDSTAIRFGEFVFSHSSQWGGYYWDGFTYATNGDNNNYGYADTTGHSGSVNWINHQWGVMAGGGIKTIANNAVTEVRKGIPYLIAYWGYYMELFGEHSLQVNLADSSLFAPQEIYICNHPWPYYGNFYGDGFARPLNHPGDVFKLIIHGVKANGTEVTQDVILAQYNANAPYNVSQSPDWKRVNLATFGNIKSLYFTMYSTDADPVYGPNTAVYFCLDKLKITKDGSAIAQKFEVVTAQKAVKTIEITDYFPVSSYTGGDVFIYDTNGKEVLKITVKTGEKINLSELPAGEYHVRHGHKTIPITKIK